MGEEEEEGAPGWTEKDPERDQLGLEYMVCFMLSALERVGAGVRSDYRWICNSVKLIVSGVPGIEEELQFEASDSAWIFESEPLRNLLRGLLVSDLITLHCDRCGEQLAAHGEDGAWPWGPEAHAHQQCRRCGKPFDHRHVNFRTTERGSEWPSVIEPLLRGHELVIMTKTMVLGTRLLHRDGRNQFDFASDTAVKISELKDLPARPLMIT